MTGGARARELLATAARITVLTGAGVSTASGIPDFRGPNGMWTANPKAARMFDIDAYIADRDLRVQAWRNRHEHPAWTARPNAAHHAVAELERQGRLRGLITQNIDELHQAAGSGVTAPLLEVHGSIKRAVCLTCRRRVPMVDVLARVNSGEDDPACDECGGILKSDTISFGQSLDRAVLAAAVGAASDCDVFLAVGSSLRVQPVAGLVPLAQQSGAEVVIVNGQPTPYDGIAASVVRDPVEQVLPQLVGVAD